MTLVIRPHLRASGVRAYEFTNSSDFNPKRNQNAFFVRYDVMKLAINNPPRPPPATTCQADLRSIGIA